MYTYAALVQRVIDGDTVVVDIDVGFHVWLRAQHIRLAHINAPELPSAAGKAAVLHLLTLLGPWLTPPQVTLQTIKDRQDKYGRYLGVFVTSAGVNVNEAMVAAGHAVPYEG